MPSRGMLLLLGIGLVVVVVAWVLLGRDPNVNDQRGTGFGGSPPASQPR
jgi:hypothetical protein